jgi:hypothetical protein
MLDHFENVFLDLKDNLELSMLSWLWSTVDGSKSIFDCVGKMSVGKIIFGQKKWTRYLLPQKVL